MESGERLPSSPASSTTPTGSAPAVASVVSKSGLSSGPPSLSSAVNPCVLEAGKSKMKVPPDSVSGAEWWRATDIHTRAGAPFFPPLLGIPPLFAPPAQNHDSSFHSRTSLVSESQTHSSFQSQQKQPQVLSQQLPFIFQSSQAKEESEKILTCVCLEWENHDDSLTQLLSASILFCLLCLSKFYPIRGQAVSLLHNQ